MKLDHRSFNEPIDPKEPSNLRGSFAKVLKRTFDTQVSFVFTGCICMYNVYFLCVLVFAGKWTNIYIQYVHMYAGVYVCVHKHDLLTRSLCVQMYSTCSQCNFRLVPRQVVCRVKYRSVKFA